MPGRTLRVAKASGWSWIPPLDQSAAGSAPTLPGVWKDGGGGAVEFANCSDVRLPSREGGAVEPGASWANRERMAGDIGIFGGGVGGMGEEFIFTS